MAITIKHAKTDNIADWTQSDLDAQIALGNFPAGTVLADIVLPSDWNNDHTVTGLGTMATQNANAIAVTGGTMSGVSITGYIPTTEKGVALGVATLDAGGQVPLSQLPALGDLNYQGTWNASTNSPTLTSSVGTKGYYYVVSVAGSTNLNGVTDWQIGDWAVFNGSVWQKVDNTDAVTSVNGYTGTVVLNAADVGAVPYTGATGAVDLNAKSLTNVSNLGINTTSVPTIKFRAFGDNGSTSRIAMRGYSSDANSSAIRVTKFRGTYAAPQAPQSGDSLGKFELAGYGTTSSDGYPQASFEGVATEAWGATARGTKTLIKVTPNTTTTQATAVTIDQDKSVTLAGALSVTGTTTLATSLSGLAKLTSGVVSTATSGSDYAPATSGSAILYGNGAGGFSSVTIGTGVSFAGGTLSATGSGGTVTSVTGTSPVVSSGGTTPAISMAAATTSVNGYLTSTDWNTFNNKGSGTVTAVSVASANGFAGTSSGGATPALTLTTSITGVLKGNGAAISAATSGTDYSAGTSALITGILKSTTTTGALSIAVAADFPTLNQSTTGSAATLTTPRAIYGNNFDGSAALTQVIASTYGGTGNGFTKFSGPTTAEKTFTLPDATATILTSNAAVTVAQGGTGIATTTAYGVITGGTTSTGNFQNAGAGTTGQVLTSNGAAALPTWQSAAGGFPTGTAMLFVQTAAPTGWTKSTTHDNKALRIVSGAASSGGSVAFTTAFASQAVAGSNASVSVTGTSDATTLTTPQIPSHTHTLSSYVASPGPGANYNFGGGGSPNTGSTGGGGSHTHGFTSATHTHTFTGTAINLAVSYVDVIIATKD
jgi:hypothetical protein